MFITPPCWVTSQVDRNAYRVYIALSGTTFWYFTIYIVLERWPAERYIKPVRIPGHPVVTLEILSAQACDALMYADVLID